MKSVCGSDGLTYDNDCERKSAQCKLKTTIELAKHGPCIKDPCENVFCPSTQKCLPSFDGASARCVCKGPCSENVSEREMVCGSDGIDYRSLCHLEKESCTKQNNLTKVYNGSCNPCQDIICPEGLECKVDQNRTPNCSCNTVCIDVVKPVCASNGKTYRNQCTMKQVGGLILNFPPKFSIRISSLEFYRKQLVSFQSCICICVYRIFSCEVLRWNCRNSIQSNFLFKICSQRSGF